MQGNHKVTGVLDPRQRIVSHIFMQGNHKFQYFPRFLTTIVSHIFMQGNHKSATTNQFGEELLVISLCKVITSVLG